MTALSRSSIVAEIKSANLFVSPILSASQIGPSSIDLRMGTVALIAQAGAQSHVNPAAYLQAGARQSSHGATQYRQQKHKRFDIPYGTSFLLHPGSLVLVPTLEWIKLPATLQGIVTARSSWAREGLNIATATLINPRYEGIVTLELANFGEIPIALHPGLRIAQLALYRLASKNLAADLKIGGSQFNGSFEPAAGNISKDDEAFIPSGRRNKKAK